MKSWDVLLIAGNIVEHKKVNDYCVRVIDGQAATGYVVKNYFNKLLKILKKVYKRYF